MKENIRDRVKALRSMMSQAKLDAYILTGADPHLSEYPAARWESRTWISGFTGSAGTIVVTKDKAGLWTDSRYFIQAEVELADTGIELYKMGLPDTLSVEEFLFAELKKESVVGVDGSSYSATSAEHLSGLLKKKQIQLDITQDLVGEIWKDRPTIPNKEVFAMPLSLSGVATPDKLNKIVDKVHQQGADATLLSALDEVAWTLNVRGSDVDFNPVAVSYVYVSEEETVWFVLPEKVPAELAKLMENDGVRIVGYDALSDFLDHLDTNKRILLDKSKTNALIYQQVSNRCEILNLPSPVALLKSVKNETELRGFRSAMIKDGVALVRFLKWLEESLAKGAEVTEMSAADQLTYFRSQQAHYVSNSFATIAGYKAHGAIVHYRATKHTDTVLKQEGLFLVDSGAQYMDGTTDITRTLSLGNPTDAEKKDFTRVLKGHISLAKCKFPRGTRGSQLDILARKALWDAGLNFLHGTGHGIGHFLNVHEGPQNIRMEENPVKLEPGMVTSNEPGVYRAGQYGIRIENLIVVHKESETVFGEFYDFETITLCPIDTSLVIVSMLSMRERIWLNKYHEMVYERLSPYLSEEEKTWLKTKTVEI